VAELVLEVLGQDVGCAAAGGNPGWHLCLRKDRDFSGLAIKLPAREVVARI
jgi:hypothetical protein